MAGHRLSGGSRQLIAGCSEVEPSSHGLVNACAAFPSEAHAAHRYAWVNNSATCCELPGIRLLRLSGWFRVTRLCPVYTGGQKWGEVRPSWTCKAWRARKGGGPV